MHHSRSHRLRRDHDAPAAGGTSAPAPAAPIAERRPHHSECHSEPRVDDYHWLREREDARVLAYLEAENAYTEAQLDPIAELRETLYQELVSRIKETDSSAPVPRGDWEYYRRTQQGLQYPRLCRRPRGSLSGELLLLDVNELARDQAYTSVGAAAVSPDQRLLAYAVDHSGAERYSLRVKDLETGELLADRLEGVYASLAWGNDNRSLYYLTLDEARRPDKVWRHRLGSEQSQDELLHHETDERFFAGLRVTRSRRWLLLELGSHTTSETLLLDADDPADRFECFWPRRQDVEYQLEHRGDAFYVLTNLDAVDFRLLRVPQGQREPDAELIPHRPGVRLEHIDAFADHLVVYRREQALPQLAILELETGVSHDVSFGEPVYVLDPGDNLEFETERVRFEYSSPLTPRSVYDYDMRNRRRELIKQDEVQGGFDPQRYHSERLHARAPDGQRIPVSLLYRKDLPRDGSAACVLHGYGAYGIPVEPLFNSNLYSLVDRGVVYAWAHVRGGGELGKTWHQAGRLEHKPNSFSDFISVAELLVAERYTSPARLAARGGSAGGLLMGAVANLRPELFAAMVANVPFVDVVNTMLDPSLPLTVIEYEEWGNPGELEAYRRLCSYSPYENVSPQAYPQLLVTAGLNDPRVQYWEPAKWVARLRRLKTDRRLLLLKTNMSAGHAGVSGRYDWLREVALEYGFLLWTLGIETGPGGERPPLGD